MNILFLSLLDFDNLSDRNIYTDLLNEFLNNGHDVYAVSPIEKRKNVSTYVIEKDNLQILKPRIGNTQKTNLIEKGISTITLESKIEAAIRKYFSDVKFDLILYTTPPITFYKTVQFVKQRDAAKTYLLLKDIFPQNAVDLGMLSKKGIRGILYRYFRRKEKRLYKISDFIGCMSQANVDFLLNKNKELANKVIEVNPNSIMPIDVKPSDKASLRQKYEIPDRSILFLYGGNLGKPQDIDYIIECLYKNMNLKDRYFIICGAGTDYYKLLNFFTIERPQNMRLINGLPKNDFDELVSACDVGLIFLDYRFTIPNFPSRLLSYMENSMPVLACTDINTDIGSVIEEGKFGWWCHSNDSREFKKRIDFICSLKDEIELYGTNARKYLENNYTVRKSYDTIMKHFV